MAGREGRSGRQKVLGPTETWAAKVETTTMDGLRSLGDTRGCELATVTRDVLAVALGARLRVARVLGYLREEAAFRAEAAEGQLLVVGPLARAEAELFGVYADLALGRAPDPYEAEAEEDPDSMLARVRQLDAAAEGPVRRARAEAALRMDLGLPPENLHEGLEVLMAGMTQVPDTSAVPRWATDLFTLAATWPRGD